MGACWPTWGCVQECANFDVLFLLNGPSVFAIFENWQNGFGAKPSKTIVKHTENEDFLKPVRARTGSAFPCGACVNMCKHVCTCVNMCEDGWAGVNICEHV